MRKKQGCSHSGVNMDIGEISHWHGSHEYSKQAEVTKPAYKSWQENEIFLQ